jgi:hypothetical protein
MSPEVVGDVCLMYWAAGQTSMVILKMSNPFERYRTFPNKVNR